MKAILSHERLFNMIRYSSPPPFQVPSGLKTPTTTDTENTKNKDAQNASPSFALPPADKKPGKPHPSPLQTQFKREEKKELIDTQILLSILWFKAKGHIDEVERKAAENVMEYLSTKGKDSVLTPLQLQKKMKGILKGAFRDMNSRLGQRITKQYQNAMPGSLDEFRASKKQAKIRIARSVADAFESEGWILHRPEKSNVQWEPNRGPILVKCGLSLQQLSLTQADIAQGGFASVSIFENENNDKFIGKTPLPPKDKNSNPKDILAIELEAYKKIYDEVGPHPNLVNAYGIGQVLNN